MNRQITNNTRLSRDGVLIVVFVFSLAYVVIRAMTLSFTHDESWTFLNLVKTPFIDKLLYTHHVPNNHYLNTILVSIGSRLWGDSEFALRLPNVVSFFIFGLSMVSISRKLSSSFLCITLFALTTGNLYVLEQYSLARGYGLGLAFMTLSLAFLFSAFDGERHIRVIQFSSLTAASLAVLSNLVFIPYFLTILMILLIANAFEVRNIEGNLQEKLSKSFNSSVSLLLLTTSLLAFILVPVVNQYRDGLFYFGSDDFLRGTITSLLHASYANLAAQTAESISYVLVFAHLGVRGLAFLLATTGRILFPKPKAAIPFIAAAILYSVWLFSFIQHYALQSQFPLRRTATFYVPLYLISLFLMLDALYRHRYLKYAVTAMAILLLASHMLLSVNRVNLSYTYGWKYDADTERLLSSLENATDADQGATTLCVYWLFKPSTSYYSYRQEQSVQVVSFFTYEQITPEMVKECDVFLSMVRTQEKVGYPSERGHSREDCEIEDFVDMTQYHGTVARTSGMCIHTRDLDLPDID